MHVFLTGGTGAIGTALVPQLIAAGHRVSALTRSQDRVAMVESLGARAFVADPLHRADLTALVGRLSPDVIIHQLTALKQATDFRHFDRDFALTNRFRTEVTDTLIAAGEAVGCRRILVQSFCGWPYAREGGPIKDENAPLGPPPASVFRQTLSALQYQERAIAACRMEGVALRYGILYGPGTSIARDGLIVDLVRRRKIPVVGGGTGIWSFTHVTDVARATTAAVLHGDPGVYNVVDDEPVPVATWLPFLARAVGAKAPRHVPTWLGRLAIGAGGVAMMTTVRGGSNAKAKAAFDWTPRYPSWRIGFSELE